jgi:hypothetical protein
MELPVVDKFIEYFHQDNYKTFLDGISTREEEVEAVRNYLIEGGSALDYTKMFEYAGVIDSDLNDLLHKVRKSRNNYIHNPLEFMEIRDATEVLSMVAKCVTVVEETEQLLDSELPVDNTFYKYFSPDQ